MEIKESLDLEKRVNFTLFIDSKYAGKCVIKGSHIVYIFVKEQHRGKGYGKILYDRAEEHIVSTGAKSITLDAEEDNLREGQLVEWYKTNFDFEVCGKPRFTYKGNHPYNIVPMIKHFK